ncbi:MAG: hypothetical protein CFE45_18410 [Burkholderiales bacterium PBB5]|nr:MAG: hypothetical protein CFE45_18410 [Burkholderiales bacterium PBB5]
MTGCLALVVAALAAVWTTRLHSADAADRQRLVGLKATPRPLAAAASPLADEQGLLQVRASGPYLGLRQWVAQALQHDDALLLERLRLSRPLASSAVLTGELNWALLQGATGSAP